MVRVTRFPLFASHNFQAETVRYRTFEIAFYHRKVCSIGDCETVFVIVYCSVRGYAQMCVRAYYISTQALSYRLSIR